MIVDVISESTRRVNEYEKRESYLAINSLRAYILLESNAMAALVYRRVDAGFESEIYEGSEAVILLPEIECNLSLADAYEQVAFLPPDPE